MTLMDLRWMDLENKRIRRPTWPEGDSLLVFGWRYSGAEWAYDGAKSESPYGLLLFKDGTRKPFDIMPGHKADDWEIV